MGVVVVILLVIVAIAYFKVSGDSVEVKKRSKGRTQTQKNVIRYFVNDGCLQKKMKDEEYDALVQAYVSQQDFKQKALNKIGLDESELKEIEPVHFEGYRFDKNAFSKYGKDNKPRSSCYQTSWLFFSASQVYLYQYTFNMDEDGKGETTDEYFYKDITSFSTSSDTVETKFWIPKEKKWVLKNVDSHRFQMSVMGEKFYCALKQTDENERAIQAMKAKLREKKSV